MGSIVATIDFKVFAFSFPEMTSSSFTMEQQALAKTEDVVANLNPAALYCL